MIILKSYFDLKKDISIRKIGKHEKNLPFWKLFSSKITNRKIVYNATIRNKQITKQIKQI